MDMGGAKAIKDTDFNLWRVERAGETFGLDRRQVRKDLRLDTVCLTRAALMKLLEQHRGDAVQKLQDIGVVRTIYGKIVKFENGFMPTFPAKKKKGKKRKKSEEDEEDKRAIQVCFCVFCVIFGVIFEHIFSPF